MARYWIRHTIDSLVYGSLGITAGSANQLTTVISDLSNFPDLNNFMNYLGTGMKVFGSVAGAAYFAQGTPRVRAREHERELAMAGRERAQRRFWNLFGP